MIVSTSSIFFPALSFHGHVRALTVLWASSFLPRCSLLSPSSVSTQLNLAISSPACPSLSSHPLPPPGPPDIHTLDTHHRLPFTSLDVSLCFAGNRDIGLLAPPFDKMEATLHNSFVLYQEHVFDSIVLRPTGPGSATKRTHSSRPLMPPPPPTS